MGSLGSRKAGWEAWVRGKLDGKRGFEESWMGSEGSRKAGWEARLLNPHPVKIISDVSWYFRGV